MRAGAQAGLLALVLAAAADAAPPQDASGEGPPPGLPRIQERVLRNGLRLRWAPGPSPRRVHLALRLRTALEAGEPSSLPALAAAAAGQGSPRLPGPGALARELRALGGEGGPLRGGGAGLRGVWSLPAGSLEPWLLVLREILGEPDFRFLDEARAGVGRAWVETPAEELLLAGVRALLRPGAGDWPHPLEHGGPGAGGWPHPLEQAGPGREELARFWNREVRAGRLVLAAVGGPGPEPFFQAARLWLGDLPGGGAEAPPPFRPGPGIPGAEVRALSPGAGGTALVWRTGPLSSGEAAALRWILEAVRPEGTRLRLPEAGDGPAAFAALLWPEDPAPLPGRDPAAVQRTLQALQAPSPGEAALEEARTRALRAFLEELEDPARLAVRLAGEDPAALASRLRALETAGPQEAARGAARLLEAPQLLLSLRPAERRSSPGVD